jgi:tetratricopeptide (TPR) repeat protein
VAGKRKKKSQPPAPGGIQEFFLRYQEAIFLLLIALLGLVIYSNAFRVPFVYDDNPLIVDNAGIRGFHFYPFVTSLGATRQIAFFTFAFNYWLNGLNVAGYHVLNLIIHILNAMLVFQLVVLTVKTPFFRSRLSERLPRLTVSLLALFAAMLFIAHPVQTQAVTYISQRFASLATLFCLASLLMYIKWRLQPPEAPRAKRISYYAATLVLAILAMRTKEISFTLPIVIALFEFTFLSGNIKRRIINLLPLMATMVVIPLSLLSGAGSSGDSVEEIRGATGGISGFDYFLTQFRVIITYLRLFFFPVGQNLDYDYPLYRSFMNLNVFLSFIFLVSLFGAGIYLFRRSDRKNFMLRLAAFGIFWFFITLAVESSINPITNLIDEHRLYLPSIGLIIALTAIVYTLLEKLIARDPNIHKFVIPVVVIAITVLALVTFERNAVWGSQVSIWRDAAAKSPNKARPHNNLGVSYRDVGQFAQAINEFEQALNVDPGFEPEKDHYNIAVCYLIQGENDKAAAELEEAIKIKPDFLGAHSNLGAAYMKLGKYEQAAAEFQQAIALKPDFAEAHYNLGIIYQQLGQNEQAKAEFEEAVRLKPDFTQAQRKLGES